MLRVTGGYRGADTDSGQGRVNGVRQSRAERMARIHCQCDVVEIIHFASCLSFRCWSLDTGVGEKLFWDFIGENGTAVIIATLEANRDLGSRGKVENCSDA